MDENTKHIVASNLTVAFYVGQAYHFPYNQPPQKLPQLDALEVLRAHQQFLRLMDSEKVGSAGNGNVND